MRKQFDGLVSIVRNELGEDPLSGSLYVFINRRRNYVKLVFWDRTGFCLFAKRLERGRFSLPGNGDTHALTEQAFRLLLDGIILGENRRSR
jgi:transposase